MARRSIEMYEYRQALMRMRQGDSEREIARSKLMGRSKAARFRELARAQGWLDPERPLPEDAEIAAALGQPKLPVTAQSSISAYRPLVEQWLTLTQGVSGVVIIWPTSERAGARVGAEGGLPHRTVKTILAGGHDLAPVSTITPEPYAGRARFARATASLFEDEGPTFH